MGRRCRVCAHPARAAIDTALVAGESSRSIAAAFSLSKSAVLRHREGHLPAACVAAAAAGELARGASLVEQVRELLARALRLLDATELAGDLRGALGGVREVRGVLELSAKLTGELDERPQVNLVVTPEFQRVRALLLEALAPYPEARAAVSARLLEEGL